MGFRGACDTRASSSIARLLSARGQRRGCKRSIWILTFSRQVDRAAHSAFGLAVVILVAIALCSHQVAGGHIAANAACLALELGLVWIGLTLTDRRWFWLGLGGLSAQVAFRFFEYDTDLVAKSIVFTLWGLTLLGAGWWFERVASRRAESDARLQSVEER
jgi:hypothetical protein